MAWPVCAESAVKHQLTNLFEIRCILSV